MALRIDLILLGTGLAAFGCTSLVGLDDYQVGSGGGGTNACDVATCPGDDTTCRYRICEGSCGMENAPANTPCTEGGGEVCDGDGRCVHAPGHACEEGSECLDGYCVDGVCCEDACDGVCVACVASSTGSSDGTCAPVPAFTDPAAECTEPPAFGCDGAAACASCSSAAPTVGSCPTECDACDGASCVFDCAAAGSCDAATINCPAGWNCQVDCQAQNSCRDVTVNCTEGYQCQVVCGASSHQCQRLNLNCPEHGPCSISCAGGDACSEAVVTCGASDCSATCNGGNFPTVHCPSTCTCTACQ